MSNELSQALVNEALKRIALGKWDVVAMAGRGAIPKDVRTWLLDTFGTKDPILIVIDGLAKEPASWK